MSGTSAFSTPTSRRVSGIIQVQVNGVSLQTVEFAWDTALASNETVMSLSGVDGFKQPPVAPFMSGKFRDNASISVSSIIDPNQNNTVVAKLANGKLIQGHNLWYVGRPNVSGADADFDFRFEGMTGSIIETGGP